MKNEYYLRESYSTPEKIDRIGSATINPAVDGFRTSLQEFGMDPDEYGGFNKSDFFETMRDKLDNDFDKFVNTLFQTEGKKGDKFNLQILELPSNRDYSEIINSVESHHGLRLDDIIGGISNVLTLSKCDLEGNLPTLGFRTAQRVEEIKPDEELPVIIRDSEGNIEAEYSEGYQVEAPIRDYIEARVYPSASVVAISNSGIKTGIQKDIAQYIIDQAAPPEVNDD